MVHIRNLRYEELDAAMELSAFAFQSELDASVRASRRKAQAKHLSQVWGAFDEENRLMAKLHLIPLQIRVGGKPMPMGGIAGVSTWPEYRRQGLVASLLKHSLEKMRSEGQNISMLHPFSFAFYRRYGWETFIELKRYTLDMKQVPKRGGDSAISIQRISRKELALPLLDEVYRQFSMQYNGMLVRTEAWWNERILSDELQLYVAEHTETGRAEGYILYKVKDHHMQIKELHVITESARRALWQLIANHDSMAKEVTLQAPQVDDLTYVLDDPRIRSENVPYFMARIVDVKGFMEAYPYREGTELEIVLRVTDEHAPWNDGDFHVVLNPSGSAAVNKLEQPLSAEEGHGRVECSIQHLTSWMLGYQSEKQLLKLELISGEAVTISRFSERLNGLPTYFPDFF